MNRVLIDHYRCPENFIHFGLTGDLSKESGYFRFGKDTICYGQSSSGCRSAQAVDCKHDALDDVEMEGSTCRLSFDPVQVVDNLRYEHYAATNANGTPILTGSTILHRAYYFVRPALPISVRTRIQRLYFSGRHKVAFPAWPVDLTVERIFEKLLLLSLKAQNVGKIPFIWFWPRGFPSCAIVTHDVETSAGRNFCSQLMDTDDSFAIKSSFQIVPEKRYSITQGFLNTIRDREFELNIQDLNHDGLLFSEREQFLSRVQRINRYAKEYRAVGYRSGGLYRNLDWYDAFDVHYDMSVPNAARLEPQPGGCCTVMPYFIGKVLELPVTTTQDYSLFHILNDYSIELWKRQIGLIMDKHGLVSFIIHPDYVIEQRARDTYVALLRYLSQLRSEGKIWIALPGEVNRWWRERSQMTVVKKGDRWCIEGPGKEQARIAYATLAGDKVVYDIEQEPELEHGLRPTSAPE